MTSQERKSLIIKSQIRNLISPHLEALITGKVKDITFFPKPELFKELPDTIREHLLTFLFHKGVTTHIDLTTYNECMEKSTTKFCSYKFLRGKKAGEFCNKPAISVNEGGDGIHCLACTKKKSIKDSKEVPIEKPIDYTFLKCFIKHNKDLGTTTNQAIYSILRPDLLDKLSDECIANNPLNLDDDDHNESSAIKMTQLVYDYGNILLIKKGDFISFLNKSCKVNDKPYYIWNGYQCLSNQTYNNSSKFPINPYFGVNYFKRFARGFNSLKLNGMKVKLINKIYNQYIFECYMPNVDRQPWIYITTSRNPKLDGYTVNCYIQKYKKNNKLENKDKQIKDDYNDDEYDSDESDSDENSALKKDKSKVGYDYSISSKFIEDLKEIDELELKLSKSSISVEDHDKIVMIYDKHIENSLIKHMNLPISEMIGKDKIGFIKSNISCRIAKRSLAHSNLLLELIKVHASIMRLSIKYGYHRILCRDGYDTELESFRSYIPKQFRFSDSESGSTHDKTVVNCYLFDKQYDLYTIDKSDIVVMKTDDGIIAIGSINDNIFHRFLSSRQFSRLNQLDIDFNLRVKLPFNMEGKKGETGNTESKEQKNTKRKKYKMGADSDSSDDEEEIKKSDSDSSDDEEEKIPSKTKYSDSDNDDD